MERLQHGKILNKKNFPQFVDTFNNTVDRTWNIKGDFDIDPKNGHIQIDNVNPTHPVIRLQNASFGKGGAGDSFRYGCFAIDDEWRLKNCYYMAGNVLNSIADGYPISESGIVALCVKAGYNETSIDSTYVTTFANIEKYFEVAKDDSWCAVPLYMISKDGSEVIVEIDMRNIPTAVMWEM